MKQRGQVSQPSNALALSSIYPANQTEALEVTSAYMYSAAHIRVWASVLSAVSGATSPVRVKIEYSQCKVYNRKLTILLSTQA